MSSIANPSFCVGFDVHKDSVTIAVLRNRNPEPMRVDGLPNDHKKLRRYFERLGAEGTVRACYVASGAGYVLQRAITKAGNARVRHVLTQAAATAVAREMVGFLWAVLNDLHVTQLQQSEVHRTA